MTTGICASQHLGQYHLHRPSYPVSYHSMDDVSTTCRWGAPLTNNVASTSPPQRHFPRLARRAATITDTTNTYATMTPEVGDHEMVDEDVTLKGAASGGGNARACAVCLEEASGMYFGALVCLPCKSFFIRSTKDGLPRFSCLANGACDVTHGNRLRCQFCRFQTCLAVGMCRKEKPEIVQPAEGQVLCRVCHDIANGVHFGVPTCEGCKKFFRRALKESNSYFCKFEKRCAMNPRNRNSCRFCRYNRCISVGMSRNAIRMGRPKKMGAADFRHSPTSRDAPTPYHNIRSPHSGSDSGRQSSAPSSPEASQHINFSHSPPPFSPHGGASVIKVSGFPPKIQDGSNTSLVGECSVIRSCGNPNSSSQAQRQTLHPFRHLQRDHHPDSGSSSASFRQTVLAYGANNNNNGRSPTGMVNCQRSELQQPLPSLFGNNSRNSNGLTLNLFNNSNTQIQNGCLNQDSTAHSPNSSLNCYSLSNSPGSSDPSSGIDSGHSSAASTMSSCSSSTEMQKEDLIDIEDDLADILSSLNQYNPTVSAPIVSRVNTQSGDSGFMVSSNGRLGSNDILMTTSANPVMHISKSEIKVEVDEFENDNIASCQFSHQQSLSQISPNKENNHSNSDNNNSAPISPQFQQQHQISQYDSPTPTKRMKTEVITQQQCTSPARLQNLSGHYPASSVIGPMSPPVVENGTTPTSPESDWGMNGNQTNSMNGSGNNNWSLPPHSNTSMASANNNSSSLVSQMYSSLMLTYNLGLHLAGHDGTSNSISASVTHGEDNDNNIAGAGSRFSMPTQATSHYDSSHNTLMPLYT